MDNDVWNAYYETKKKEYEDRIEAEKKAEKERIERERVEAEERKRIALENEKLKKEGKERERLEKIEADKRLKIEEERKAKEEAERKIREEKERKERAEYERKIKAEREEKERKVIGTQGNAIPKKAFDDKGYSADSSPFFIHIALCAHRRPGQPEPKRLVAKPLQPGPQISPYSNLAKRDRKKALPRPDPLPAPFHCEGRSRQNPARRA